MTEIENPARCYLSLHVLFPYPLIARVIDWQCLVC